MSRLANVQQSVTPGFQRAPFLLPEKSGWLRWHRDEAEQVVKAFPSASSTALQELLEPIQIWQQAGTSTVYIPRIEIRLLERLYIFREPKEVSRFLEDNPFLILLLLEAYGQIERYFGPYPQVFLEVVTDPEAPDDRELFALIYTGLTPDEALDGLDRFDRNWWLDASQTAQGKLCIDVEFL
jgi:hypothetical protein